MKLLRMKLENFQGIKALGLDFKNGMDVTIRGDNATGKTTIANAQSWLLTGKSSEDEKNYTPKTQGARNLEHSVECTYELDNGAIVTLKKVLKEKYTKKRGSTTAEFSGHSVDYFKDDVPVKEKEFNEFLRNVVGDVERVLMLMNVSYFSRMDWKKRRQLLLEMCGDYSDDYIIASNPELLELKSILLKDGTTDQFHTVEDFMKMTKERMKKTNSDIQMIPARIDEANRAIPDVSVFNKECLQKEVSDLEVDIENLKKEKLLTDNSDQEKARQEKIHDVQMKIKDARITFVDEQNKISYDHKQKVNDVSSKINDIQLKMNTITSRIRNATSDLNYMTEQRNKLLQEYQVVQTKEWDTNQEVCPTCGRELPLDQIEELKAKFNSNKSNQLEEINKRGQVVSKAAIQEQQELIDKLESEKTQLGTDLILAKQELSSLESEKPTSNLFESTETYRILNEELSKLQNMAVSDVNAAKKSEIENHIIANNQMLQDKQRQLSLFDTVDYQNKRIDELKDLQRKLSSSYENMESEIYLCEQFIKSKVDMITENINEKFKNVSFRLFETQVNGGLKECCDVMIPSAAGVPVPYEFANNAAQINAGLEIISILQGYYRVSLPIFVDNAESVTKLNEIDSQIIRLVVDEKYKELTMMEE